MVAEHLKVQTSGATTVFKLKDPYNFSEKMMKAVE